MNHQSSHPCLLSSNVSKQRSSVSSDLFVPPPSFPPANSPSLPSPPPTADEPGRNQQSMPGQDRNRRVSTNDLQDALKPGTRIPGSGIVVGFKDTSRSDGFWWCKCWCGREFVEHESSIRNALTRDCGGPKHHQAFKPRRSRMKGLRRPS